VCVSFLVLVIRHAIASFLRSIIVSSVAYLGLQCFFILPHKRYVCRKNCTQNVKVK